MLIHRCAALEHHCVPCSSVVPTQTSKQVDKAYILVPSAVQLLLIPNTQYQEPELAMCYPDIDRYNPATLVLT